MSRQDSDTNTETDIELAAKQWFELILATIESREAMKIKNNEKLHN